MLLRPQHHSLQAITFIARRSRYYLLPWVMILCGCHPTYDFDHKQPVLIAERSTLLDGIYLRLYDDHSFEVIVRRVREDHMYFGSYDLRNDTLQLAYSQEIIPEIGEQLLITSDELIQLNNKASLNFKLNALDEIRTDDPLK